VQSRALETNNVAFNNGAQSRLRPVYSRSARFLSKVLGALNRRISCAINPKLINHLKEKDVKTPEAVLEGIRTWVTAAARKPYVHASVYGVELGLSEATMTERDIRVICTIFDEIFFAHKRLGFEGPNFPFSELLHLITQTFHFDTDTLYVVRYAKRLRCPIRTTRYHDMYMQCLRHAIETEKIDPEEFKCKVLTASK